MIKHFFTTVCALLLCLVASCSSKPKNGLTVAATPVPHAQMLEFVKPDLKAQGIDLTIVVFDDYNTPNRALAGGEVDANFFQHLPYLEEQVRQFKYPIMSIANIEIEPIGIYSKQIRTLSELKEEATVAVPNDPTNEARSLMLLQEHGIIELDDSKNLQATILNITKNPKRLKFIEVDAAMIPRALTDVDLACINTNFALQAGLSPLKDALALESKDSPYANILVIRVEDKNRADIQALKAAMTSEKMRKFILDHYKGAVLPAF